MVIISNSTFYYYMCWLLCCLTKIFYLFFIMQYYFLLYIYGNKSRVETIFKVVPVYSKAFTHSHYSILPSSSLFCEKKKRSALLSRYDGILSIQIAVLKILLFVVLWNILKILVVSTEYGFHWLVKTLQCCKNYLNSSPE